MKNLLKNPPKIGYALILLAVAFHFGLPIFQVISFPYTLLGIIVGGIGLWAALSTKKTFKKNRVALPPGSKSDKILLDGLFRYSRNPMYLGMVMFILGISTLLGSLTALFAPVIYFLIFNVKFIPMEERMMEEQFGKEFLDYKNKVRRWI